MLKLSLGSVDIHVQQVYALGDHVVVEFYATDGKGSIANATKVYYKLTKKGHDQTIIDFHIVLVEMKGQERLHCEGVRFQEFECGIPP